ncbi:hypothetical protein RCJ22_09340 [Vibrio sp. FNV 38]|nr:hypothetical protein [Vibrio sp. FNV 38]
MNQRLQENNRYLESLIKLRQRDFIELKAHQSLSHQTVISSAKALIQCYVRYNPDYLSPLAKLLGFELKLSASNSIHFAPSGSIIP